MPIERPPVRLLRVLLITLLLIGAIVTLLPEEPQQVSAPVEGKALASTEMGARSR